MADDAHLPGLEPVTVEQDGRIFSGVGVTPEALAETMDARTPEVPETAETAEASGTDAPDPTPISRNPDGTFTKPTRGQRRFAEMKKREAEAVAAATKAAEDKVSAAERRAQELESRLAALEARRQERAPEPEPATPPAPAGRPKPTEDQIGEKYATYADFVEDLADWRVEQRLEQDVTARIEARFAQQRTYQTEAQQLQTFQERARAAYPDFDAVLANAPTDIVYPDLRVLVNAPNAEHLVYTLAKDPDLARKIATERDPIRLGYLMASVRPPEAVVRPASTTPAVASNAPAPYQPVGTGSKTTTPTLGELAASGDDYDASGYREQRAAQRRGSRR